MTYSWRSFFAKNLRYKRPFLINSHYFYEKPSDDGTLPEDDLMGDILSESSSDDESEERKVDEFRKAAEEKAKLDKMSPDQRDELKKKEEYRRKNPLPLLPDVEKFDKVFVMPIFIKPGK
mmetsp:Transcript_3421/g.4527  ORF Transcript_3421/g.4527 Transcript_3421/m.4527 type:complete len:120 (-) Transcript_3421:1343-1702(-)